MKLTGIISIIMLTTYSLLTYVGVGVYHCGCTHSERLVMMAFQPVCPCNNSAEDCCTHHDSHHNDENDCGDEDCCSLAYQRIEVDQLYGAQFQDVQVKVLSLFFSPVTLVDCFVTGIEERFIQIKNHSPPGLLKIPIIYLHSQLRL